MGIIEHITKIGHLPIRDTGRSPGGTITKEIVYIQCASDGGHFLTGDMNENHTGQQKALTLNAFSFTLYDTVSYRKKGIYLLQLKIIPNFTF